MWSAKGQRKGKAALEPSNFAQTCNLLSQYMKEKGTLRDLNLEIGGKVESLEALVKPGSALAAPTSANSDLPLPTKSGRSGNPIVVEEEDDSNKDSTSKDGRSKDPKSAQLTIFYSGKVLVFDDFPTDKVRDIVHVAKRSSSRMSYGITSSVAAPDRRELVASPRDGLPPRPQPAGAGKQPVGVSSNTGKEKLNASTSEAGPSSSEPREVLSPTSEASGSDLPIARRSSLNRFLEKRKDRAAVRGPYHNNQHNQENTAPIFKRDEPIDLNNFPSQKD